MTIANDQLRKFYATTQPDLTGKQLRSALRYDRRAVRRSRRHQNDGELASLFAWDDTPEGATYWYRRSCCDASVIW